MSTTKVSVPLVSLKTGDVLSTVLPGCVALLAAAPYYPLLDHYLVHLDQLSVGGGLALLIAAAIAGGIMEALTRLTWERHYLKVKCPLPTGTLRKLTDGHQLDLYERGVQASYKYVTFYSNLGFAVGALLASRLAGGVICTVGNLAILALIPTLFAASYVQWTYFVNYMTQVFGGDSDAGQRPAPGNTGQVREGSEKREGE